MSGPAWSPALFLVASTPFATAGPRATATWVHVTLPSGERPYPAGPGPSPPGLCPWGSRSSSGARQPQRPVCVLPAHWRPGEGAGEGAEAGSHVCAASPCRLGAGWELIHRRLCSPLSPLCSRGQALGLPATVGPPSAHCLPRVWSLGSRTFRPLQEERAGQALQGGAAVPASGRHSAHSGG